MNTGKRSLDEKEERLLGMVEKLDSIPGFFNSYNDYQSFQKDSAPLNLLIWTQKMMDFNDSCRKIVFRQGIQSGIDFFSR